VLNTSPVPPEGRRYIRIASPKVGKPVRFFSLSSAVLGVWTHWVDGRSHPCFLEGCAWCTNGTVYPRRWKGYLYGHDIEGHVVCLLELPADTVRGHIQLRDASVNLCGASIIAERIGPSPNSSVRAVVRLDAAIRVRAAQEPDVMAHLARIWGVPPETPSMDLAGGDDV